MKHIDPLLKQPVDVLDVGTTAGVVLANAQIVQLSHVHGIAVGVVLGTVIVAVTGILGMPVGVTAIDAVGLALRLDLIAADARYVLLFVGVLHEPAQFVSLSLDQSSRVDRRVQNGQLGGQYLAALIEILVIDAVVGCPSGVEAAVCCHAEPMAGVGTPSRGGNRDRIEPVAAIEGRRIRLPCSPMRRSSVRNLALAQMAVPKQRPDPAVLITSEARKVVKPAQVRRHRRFEPAGRLTPYAAIVDCDRDSPGLIQLRGGTIQQEPGVLSPLQSALVPGHPQAIVGIACKAGVGFVAQGVRNRLDI